MPLNLLIKNIIVDDLCNKTKIILNGEETVLKTYLYIS